MSLYYEDDHVQLFHGDCLEITEWLTADVLVTDPPYGSDRGQGYGRHGGNKREGAFHIKNDSTTETRDAVLSLWGNRPVACFGTPRMAEPPGEWVDRLVWDKCEPGLNGGPWRYTHESIFVRGDGWKRTSASAFSVIRVPSGNGTWEKAQHVHAKPVALMQALIMAAPQGVICDPFAGSGSTLVAAKALGRKAIGVELEERHCKTAVLRLAQGVLDFGETA